ncbi:putative MFS family arabinose efflux permease [Kribbella sp. VKM Ac-2569]|uniref:MFS transporter n=1 Tax=Kribbella sp. VKM Ac-2569 TaxID=2512220 RepID=UPI0010D88221|nr:MFS transporter [Kribbella sp. VKM Ac-2569]RZT13458.1 putative MFS family arabinose efflux permease [Kribbella sp. VKM Ac-2569]
MTQRFNRHLIAPMLVGSILNPINSSMLAVALIPIGAAFGVPPSQTAWLVTGLYLATAVGQPVMGRLVDLFGPRPLYLFATSLVGLAGLLGALAPNLGVLVASRVLLGLGTSAAYPASMSLIRSEADRTGMDTPAAILSSLSIANQVIAVIGPTLGGLLIGLGGWHLIFTINVPLSVICVVLGALWLPRRARSRGAGGLDYVGIVLFAGTLVSLMFFLMQPRVSRWYLLVLAIALGAAFVIVQLRVVAPFIDLRVLGGNRPLILTYARQVLAFVGAYSFLYGFTQWLEEARGLGASSAGLLLLPLSLAAVVITALTGRRAVIRGKLVAGGLFLLLAAAAQLFVGPSTPIWILAVVGVIAGVPQGLNNLANQTALYKQADPVRIGSSAGLLRTCVYVGALISAAANAHFFQYGATTAGLHDLAIFLLVVAGLLLLVTFLDLPE